MEALIIAFVIDLTISDNLGIFHPVVIIGKYIKLLESRLYGIKNKRFAGILLLLFVCLTSSSFSFLLIKAVSFNKWLLIITSGFLISTTFALKGLVSSGIQILKELKDGHIEKARALLSQIVGRDTNNLNRSQIIKATIESLAENTVDSIIAPLFYALIGGPVLAIVYRSINTLDSMVGYKNKRYLEFGWASAKTDDIAKYIPARLSLLFVWLATFLCRYKFTETIKYSLSDGPKHLSPNSGLSEAAFAGALGIQLGGIAYYDNLPINLPVLGVNNAEADLNHIGASLKLISISSLLFFSAAILTKAVII